MKMEYFSLTWIKRMQAYSGVANEDIKRLVRFATSYFCKKLLF